MSYPGQSLGGVLPLCRGAVCVFYSPNRLRNSANNSGLFLLWVASYARGFSLLYISGSLILFVVCFLEIPIPNLLLLLGILSGLGLCIVLKGDFFLVFYPWLFCVFYMLECNGWILYSFGGANFWRGGIVGCLLVCGRYLWWFGHLLFHKDLWKWYFFWAVFHNKFYFAV